MRTCDDDGTSRDYRLPPSQVPRPIGLPSMPVVPSGGEVVRAEAVTVPTSASINASPAMSMETSVVAESCNRIAPSSSAVAAGHGGFRAGGIGGIGGGGAPHSVMGAGGTGGGAGFSGDSASLHHRTG